MVRSGGYMLMVEPVGPLDILNNRFPVGDVQG